MIECIENQQMKKQIFEPDQKHTKKVKRSLENNLKTNGCTIANTRIYKEIMKRPIAEATVQRYPVNKVLLKMLQSS